MTQEAATELLSDYLDGELTDAEVAELEHRLARDPTLQQELDQLRAAVDLLRTHGPVQAPPSLYASIMEAVDDEPARGGLWRWLQRPFGIPLQTLAVAAVAILVIGVSVGGVLTVGGLDLTDSREVVSSSAPAKSESKEDGWAAGEEAPAADPVAPNADDPNDAVADVGELKNRMGTAEPAPSEPEIVLGVEPNTDKLGSYDGTLAQNAMPVGTADDDQVGDALGVGTRSSTGTSTKESVVLDGAGGQYVLTLRSEDLPIVAKLYQRYAGSKSSSATANQIVATPENQQTLYSLTLPDAAARNAFLAELKRTFPGAYRERPASDKSFMLNAAKVELVIYVSGSAPSGQEGTGQVQTLRKKATKSYEQDDAQPASTSGSSQK